MKFSLVSSLCALFLPPPPSSFLLFRLETPPKTLHCAMCLLSRANESPWGHCSSSEALSTVIIFPSEVHFPRVPAGINATLYLNVSYGVCYSLRKELSVSLSLKHFASLYFSIFLHKVLPKERKARAGQLGSSSGAGLGQSLRLQRSHCCSQMQQGYF